MALGRWLWAFVVWSVASAWLMACDEGSSLVGDFDVYDAIPSSARLPAPAPGPISSQAPASTMFKSPHFTGSGHCATCHDEATDGKGQPVPIVEDWSSTMMANAARDPFWQAKVASEIKRAPSHRAGLTHKCSTCHAPMAIHEARVQKKPYASLSQLLDASDALYPLAMAGVGCTLCHQIVDDPTLGTPQGASGAFRIQTYKEPLDRKLFGPFDDALTQPMRDNVGYTPTGSKHIRDSRLCSGCHELKTAYVDASGAVVPQRKQDYFPEQMTYSEWKHSRYSDASGAQSCQWCHMAPVEDAKLSFGPPWLKTRPYIRRHSFAGANLFMLRMFRQQRELLGLKPSAQAFDRTLAQAKALMARGISLSIPEKSRWGGHLRFVVEVRNKAGHKFPTGYPSRRAFLQVEVKDAGGKVLFLSGKVLDGGHIVGVDHKTSAYSPHYSRITRPDQVQIYESIMADSQGALTYTLLRAARYLKDNRLLPEGADKAALPKDIAVVGRAKDDADFGPGSDRITYDLRGFPGGPLSISVRLCFQSIAYRFALDLFRDKQEPLVGRFLHLYRKSKTFVDAVASTSFAFP